MAKKSGARLTTQERFGGLCFLVFYILILPLISSPVKGWVGKLLDTTISDTLWSTVTYYALFAVGVILFRSFLSDTTRRFTNYAGGTLRQIGLGLVCFYGLNELVYRLSNLLFTNQTNLNDMAISAQIETAPRMTTLIVVLLAPFVEELLFRGYLFGILRERSRLWAYVISCALFAFLHVWQYAVVNHDVTYLILMLQYLVPGVLLAWLYERCGNLWGPFGLHALVNALSVWAIVR